MATSAAKAPKRGNPIFWLEKVCSKYLPPKTHTGWKVTKHPEKDVYELWYGEPGAQNESYKTWNGVKVRELMASGSAEVETYFGDILRWVATKA